MFSSLTLLHVHLYSFGFKTVMFCCIWLFHVTVEDLYSFDFLVVKYIWWKSPCHSSTEEAHESYCKSLKSVTLKLHVGDIQYDKFNDVLWTIYDLCLSQLW